MPFRIGEVVLRDGGEGLRRLAHIPEGMPGVAVARDGFHQWQWTETGTGRIGLRNSL
jgi:hypothetical protein